MATYIKTLKEDNGDITYPQTKAGAVLLDNGSDLETTLAAKADASTVNQKITVGDVQSTDIVANAVTTAKIADGAVTTNKIADNGVTSDKMDWATLYKAANQLSATLPVKANTETTVQSFTLPAGKWIIFWAIRGYGNYAQNDITYGGLKVNGDKVQNLAVNNATTGGTLRPYISCSYEANITETSTVSTYIQMVMQGNVSAETTYLFALRVG